MQKENRRWDHFLFWLGFSIKQGDHVKKSLLNKESGFAKKFIRKVFEDLVQDSSQKASSCQRVEDLGNENQKKALENDQEYIMEDEIIEKTINLNPQKDISSTEQK